MLESAAAVTMVISTSRRTVPRTLLPLVLSLGVTACMLGPNYRRPPAPLADQWVTAGDARVRTDDDVSTVGWWRVFDDPTLDRLVHIAYRENLTLQAAGLRVLQAQALRGVAIGGLYPQTQRVGASYTRSIASKENVTPITNRYASSWQAGFDAAWELDLWGRFRRDIESADARLLAAVADYDDVLVSLIAEVATTYVQIRILDERTALARENVRVQNDSLEVARVRYEAGGTSELDVQQATTLLRDTEAVITQLEIQLRQQGDALNVLLAMPPGDLGTLLESSHGIPAAPPNVSVGIPADLLRRRPDVGRAERQLAAQSAQIGVALSDLLPHVQLAGSIGLSARTAGKLAQGRAFEAAGGPSVNWDVLNYGRLINDVRFQDAVFQELAANYQNTVLRAQQDVHDALVAYVRGAEQVALLTDSVTAANRAVDLALIQYREGATDYTRVLNTQQQRVRAQDALAQSQGNLTLSVIALYKALGGGWELRNGDDFVPEATKQEMRARTWWGGVLDADERSGDIRAAAHGTERGGSFRVRDWLPKW